VVLLLLARKLGHAARGGTDSEADGAGRGGRQRDGCVARVGMQPAGPPAGTARHLQLVWNLRLNTPDVSSADSAKLSTWLTAAGEDNGAGRQPEQRAERVLQQASTTTRPPAARTSVLGPPPRPPVMLRPNRRSTLITTGLTCPLRTTSTSPCVGSK
jgi:hypothetical protein